MNNTPAQIVIFVNGFENERRGFYKVDDLKYPLLKNFNLVLPPSIIHLFFYNQTFLPL